MPGPGFALVLDAASLGAAACAPGNIAGPVLTRAVLDAEAALGVDAALAIVLTSAPLSCGGLYYLPLANDVRGIGYSHQDPRELFDDTPEHRLEGIAFLNDWPYWQAHPEELPGALYHELGHRWGARVYARIGGESSSALLGRDHEHWSYFWSSEGSPLEGNVWREAVEGFVSDTPTYPSHFSMLDLYLMGVATPEEVPPGRLLQPQGNVPDCAGHPAGPSSPPQTCGAVALNASSTVVSLADIVEVEGPRAPPGSAEPRRLDVLALVLHTSNAPWDTSQCEAAALSVEAAAAGFATATRDRLRLDDVLGEGLSCADLSLASGANPEEPPPERRAPHPVGCAIGEHRPAEGDLGLGVGALLAIATLRRVRWRP